MQETLLQAVPKNQDANSFAQDLRRFLTENARLLADEVEHGDPVDPRRLMLLVNSAREIIDVEVRA